MAKKVQLMTNAKEWQTVNGVEVLVDNVPQEDIDPITDSNCVEIEGHRTLEETISQDNMFTPEIVETKVHSKVGGVYHDNVVDGAYEEAILYGNTQVNLVESMTSGTKYIPHSFTSFQGNESKIGNYHNGRTNQVAPLVKGVTMVNLVSESKHSDSIASGHATRVGNIKGDTLYTLSFTFTTKNTNAGITIQSFNNGTYLEDTKSQTNLGDKVVMTFTTHAEANQINICNNKAYGGETIQLDDIMVIEGDVTDLNLPFFKGMRSVELARPLTNLLDENTRYTLANASKATYTYDNGTATITATALGMYTAVKLFLDEKLKSNTTYLVMWDSRTYTSTSSHMEQQGMLAFDNNKHQSLSNSYPNENPLCPTLRSLMFNTGDTPLDKISIEIRATLGNSETGTTTVTGLRVFEWDDSLRSVDLQSLGYFSGTKYVSTRALETEGKNLYPYGDINFTPTQVQWHDAKGTNYMYGDIAQKSKCRFLLKKGTYKLSSDYNNRTNLGYMALVTDKEETMEDTTFTLEEDTYLTLRLQPVEANVPTTLTNIQIERGETVTTYEAYQGRYYKPRETEEIILRSLPNGVCDTFNLQTGELVQNIGEVVLNGSEDEDWSQLEFSGASTVNGIADTYICYGLLLKDKARLTKNMLLYGAERHVIDTLNISSVYGDTCNQADISTEMVCLHQNGRFYLRLRKDRFASTDLAGWKLWFSQNPITVQYELKEPIITKLQTYNRVYSGQTNAPTSMGNNLSALTYYNSNYYLKVGNLSPIPAILEPITTIPYDVRLKPSTLYTVKYNRGGNSSSMKFDLGGSVVEKINATTLGIVPEEFTVRTPAILSHEQLQLSGTGYAHNFIVVEGDITGTELPYFEGMKDVKMPIVKNVGKNLLNESSMRVFYESGITLRTYDVFACKPNTRYCFVSVGGEANCNWHVCNKDAHYERPESESVGITQYLGYSKEIVTPQDCYYMCIHTGSSPTTDREVYDIKTAIYEGSFAECVNYGYEDYKENSVYAVQGEYPITSEMIEQGGFSAGNGKHTVYEPMKYESSIRLRNKDLIPVKPNTTYHIDATNMGRQLVYNIYQWNGNREFMEDYSYTNNDYTIPFTFTTTADTQYIHMLYSKYGNGDITVAEYDWSQFHMYELDSTINLRSLPNGVKDELNLLTGEYIQRVGEVVIDGSGDYTEHIHASSTHYGFRVPVTLKPKAQQYETYPRPIICDKLSSINYSSYFNGAAEGVSMYVGESTTISNIYISFDRNRINMAQEENSIYHVKEYCKTNPLTIQYELEEPIISHVRLVSNNQEREVGVKLPNGVCNTYNPSTGITTVRVGKIVLDGSEKFNGPYTAGATVQGMYYYSYDLPVKRNTTSKQLTTISSGGMKSISFASLWLLEQEGVSSSNSEGLGLRFATKCATASELQQYFASNPTTVWYELNYPQIQPDIVLPNGVHDEYNPETGVYTKKVGFTEFDGSADEGWRAAQTDPNRFVCEILTDRKYYPHDTVKDCILCDEIVVISYKELYGTDGTDGAYGIAPYMGNINIQMRLEGITTAEQLQQYLSQNPIKVWYELATPITYKLTPYFGLPQPYAYEDGYLIHESAYPETTLPPEFKYKLVANRTGQIVQNGRKLQEHTTRLSNLEALIIEATIESLFNRELQLFELELMDIQLIDLGE